MKNLYPVDPKHLKSYFWCALFCGGVVVLTVAGPGVGPSNTLEKITWIPKMMLWKKYEKVVSMLDF